MCQSLFFKGWLYGDFHSGLQFQLRIPRWKKLQLYEKFQTRLKKFQPGMKNNSFEEIENLVEGWWNERRKKVNERRFNRKPLYFLGYNPCHNILTLFNNFGYVWITTSKTILDIYHNKFRSLEPISTCRLFSLEATFFNAKTFDNGKYKKDATNKIRSCRAEVFCK